MKLSKFIFFGTILYLFLFLIDFLTTLFSINKTGIYKSKLGLKIDMVMNDQELYTTFSLTTQILITYISWILLLCLLFLVFKFIKFKSLSK